MQARLKVARWSALCIVTPFLLTACGGSDDNGDDGGPSQELAAPASLAASYGAKRYDFSWKPVAGASSYALFEDPDGAGPQPEVEIARIEGASADKYSHDIASLLTRVNATYRVRACNASGCGAFSAALTPDLVQAIGYFKASNAEGNDYFGYSVALSADGQTLAVGAPRESSFADAVNGSQTDNSLGFAGAVYVFRRGVNGWQQQAYVKPSNPLSHYFGDGRLGMQFGWSVSLSADGNVLAVGAPVQAVSGRDKNGKEVTDASTSTGGAVYLFARQGDEWREQAYLRASKAVAGRGEIGSLGRAVALSADGKTLAVCAPDAYLASTPEPESGQAVGLALVYGFSNQWTELARLAQPADAPPNALFCTHLGLSGDGQTLAATGIQYSSGGPGDNPMQYAAVFSGAGDAWTPQTHMTTARSEGYLGGVALSHDGNTVAVGLNGDQYLSPEASRGSAYVYVRSGTAWQKQAHLQTGIKPSAEGVVADLGRVSTSLALSSDGSTLALGVMGDSSQARGLDGDATDRGARDAGAAYLYQRSGESWSQTRYVKASNSAVDNLFGTAVALSGDGKVLAVGATEEQGASSGIQGDQTQNATARAAGAVYVY